MATFTVYKARSGARYGVLSGGDTEAYDKIDGRWFESIDPNNPNDSGDSRDWLSTHDMHPHEYAWSFAHVYIKGDVESIGAYTFAYFENADFTFEKPETIKHLGKGAFACTGIRSVKLPGLQDSSLAEVFSGCSKLKEVDLTGSKVTAIDANAFRRCHNLKRVIGCGNVTTIGELAFSRCPSLMYIDFNPRTLKRVGYAAFHVSGLGGRLDGFRDTAFAEASRRADKFDAETLDKIRAEELPDVGGLPATVCEQSYPDIPYGYYPIYNADGTVNAAKSYDDYMSNGCLMLSTYHVYQRMFPDSGYADFPAWWDEVDRRCMETNGDHIYQHWRYDIVNEKGNPMKIFYDVADLMGIECKNVGIDGLAYGPNGEAVLTYDERAKRVIWQALASGYGVIAGISTSTPTVSTRGVSFSNSHEVAIVGCRNGKLIVVDSASIDGERGGVYEVAYEDLFIGCHYADNHIRVLVPKEVNA